MTANRNSGPSNGLGHLTGITPSWRPATVRHYQRKRWLRALQICFVFIIISVCLGTLIWLLMLTPAPKLKPLLVIAAGASSYDHLPPRPCGQADAAWIRSVFLEWNHRDYQVTPTAQSRVRADSLNDRLTAGALYDAITEKLDEHTSEFGRDFPVLIYLSFHGMVATRKGDVRASLLGVNADYDQLRNADASIQLELSRVFSAIRGCAASHVLLVLDITSLPPGWSSGVLTDDLSRVLKESCREAMQDPEFAARCSVMLSCDSGQLNWPHSTALWSGHAPSVLARYLGRAFMGQAESQQRQSEQNDGSLSVREVVEFVKRGVKTWSLENRGLVQDVVVFHGQGTDQRLMSYQHNAGGNWATFEELPPRELESQLDRKLATLRDNQGEKQGSEQKPDATITESPSLSPEKTALSFSERIDKAWNDLYSPFPVTAAGTGQHEFASLLLPNERISVEKRLCQLDRDEIYGLQNRRSQIMQECEASIQQFQVLMRTPIEPKPSNICLALNLSPDPSQLAEWLPEFRSLRDRLAVALNSAEPVDTKSGKAESEIAPTQIKVVADWPKPLSESTAQFAFLKWLFEETLHHPDFAKCARTQLVLTQLNQSLMPVSEMPLELLVLKSICEQSERERIKSNDPRESMEKVFLEWCDAWRKYFEMIHLYVYQPGSFDNPEIKSLLKRVAVSLADSSRWMMAEVQDHRRLTEQLGELHSQLLKIQSLMELIQRAEVILNEQLLHFPDYAYWIAWGRDGKLPEKITASQFAGSFRQPFYSARTELMKMKDSDELEKHKSNLLAHWPYRNGSEQTQQEIQLLKLWGEILVLRRDLRQLRSGETPFNNETQKDFRDQIDRLEQTALALRRTLERQISTTALQTRQSITDLRMLLNGINMPWVLRDPQNRRVVKNSLLASQNLKFSPGQKSLEGVWLGFWGLMYLELSETRIENLDDAWRNWETLAISRVHTENANSESSLLVTDERLLRLIGTFLADSLAMLREKSLQDSTEARRPSMIGDELIPSLVRQSATIDASSVAAMRRLRRQHLLLESFPVITAVMKDSPLELAFHQLQARVNRELPPEIEVNTRSTPALSGEIVAGLHEPTAGRLQLEWNRGQLKPAEGLLLKLCSDQVGFINSSGEWLSEISLNPADNTIRQTFQSKEPITVPLSVTLQLITTSGHLWDERKVVINPMFESDRWKIVFRRKHASLPLYTTSTVRKNTSRFRIPPQGEYEYSAFLSLPESTQAQQIEMTAWTRDPATGRQHQLGQTMQIDVAAESREYPLTFLQSTESSPTPPAISVDIAEGLEFRAVPDGNQDRTVKFQVDFDYWNWQQYVDAPVLKTDTTYPTKISARFNGKTISNSDFDTIPQEKIDLSLELLGTYQLKPGSAAESAFKAVAIPDKTHGELRFELLGEQEDLTAFPHQFELAFHIHGIPHAIRWRYDYLSSPPLSPASIDNHSVVIKMSRDSPLQVNEKSVRIFSRKNGPESLSEELSIHVDSEALEKLNSSGESCKLELRSAPWTDKPHSEFPTGLIREWELNRKYRWLPRLTLAPDNTWKIRGELSNFQHRLDLTSHPSGRYQLIASLSEGSAHKDLLPAPVIFRRNYIIDNHPPTAKTTVPDRLEIGQSLPVTVIASDHQSGIKEVVVWLDENGSRSVESNESFFRKADYSLAGEAHFETTFEIKETFLPDKLPHRPGKYPVLAEVTDWSGQKTISEPVLINLVEPPPAMLNPSGSPSEVKEKLGVLILEFSGRSGVYKVTVSGPRTEEFKHNGGGEAPKRIDKAPAGDYVINWRESYGRKGMLTVTVKPGETKRAIVNVN